MKRTRMLGLTTITAVAAMACGLTTTSALASSGSLVGAGSTLINPLMQDWINGDSSSVSVAYGSVGSGTGIADITAKSVDFGASDAPLTATQQGACNAAWGATCVMIPWGLTAVAISFNVPGIKYLKLTGTVIAQIYLGVVKNWNDPAIKKLNPKVSLPNLAITPAFRSDGSGDTYAFTNYLSKISSTWARKVGFATSVSFPAGVGGKGNPGVSSVVKGTPGAIGYVSASYVLANALPGIAEVQNAAKNYEFPNLKNISNAAASVTKMGPNNALSITNPPKKFKIAYPISTFTYCIVPVGAPKKALLQQFIDYAITSGQAYGAGLDFAPLPAFVVTADKNAAASLVGHAVKIRQATGPGSQSPGRLL